MRIIVTRDPRTMGQVAAESAANHLRQVLQRQSMARLVVATGASQFEVLSHLIAQPGVDWARVEGFHLDEYVGLSPDHPASFCRYLNERFVSQVPLAGFEFLRGDGLQGDGDAQATIDRVGKQLSQAPIDLMLCGIGENGHLAFNDPPADFDADAPYLIVALDEACRQQQVGEGWFASLSDVPTHAMSMSIRQIMAAEKIICSVPDERKSKAVRATVEEPVSPQTPASILQTHPDVELILDESAAALLSPSSRTQNHSQ